MSDGCDRVPSLFVLSGPSGVGKDSVMAGIRDKLANLHVAVTATTRLPRPGEENGRSYYFLSEDDFLQRRREGKLAAIATVHGHHYGAPISEIRDALNVCQDVLLRVDVQGAAQLRTEVTGAVYIFLAPKSLLALSRRLAVRQTESSADRKRRLRDAEFEMAQASLYDYCVVNEEGQLARAIEQVACIITAESLRLHREPPAIRLR